MDGAKDTDAVYAEFDGVLELVEVNNFKVAEYKSWLSAQKKPDAKGTKPKTVHWCGKRACSDNQEVMVLEKMNNKDELVFMALGSASKQKCQMVVKEPDWPKNKCVALMTKLAKMYADGKVNTKEEIYTQRDFLKSTESSVF